MNIINILYLRFRWAKLQTSEGDITGLTLRGRLGDAVKSIRYTLMEPSEFSNGPVAVR